MSDKIEDGGSAFPVQSSTWDYKGLTVRDWFAGQALAGLLASGMTYGGSSTNRGAVANDAYAHADAMLAARKAGA
ncbi:hypothetical protein GOL29_03290 [Sinorhizobium medicae]|nr:hypothetical protein [Sinorhizobium medicae]